MIMFLFLVGFSAALMVFIGGFLQINVQIDETQEEEYRKAVVMENLLSLDGDTSHYNYDYNHRRAVLPVEYFANEGPTGDELGYEVRGHPDLGHCYIPEVAGLDGYNFAFKILPVGGVAEEALNEYGNPIGTHNEDFKSVVYEDTSGTDMRACAQFGPGAGPRIRQEAVSAPAMLVRKNKSNPVLPVRLFIYDTTYGN